MEVHVEIAAETLFKLGPLSVTNSMLTMFMVMGVILLLGWLVARKAKDIPERGQGFAELIVEFLLGLVEGTAGKAFGRRIFPLIGAIFIFVLLANYSGLFPGVGVIGFYETEEVSQETTTEGEEQPADKTEESAALAVASVSNDSGNATGKAEEGAEKAKKVLVPFLRAPNADLNMTLALALVTFMTVQVLGIRSHGVKGRLKHLGDPPFLFPIEVISEFSRIISLSARLFGNVFAGEVLLGVMYAMAASIKIAVIPVFFPVIFLGLEMLFGAIQALVFALLTLIYITLAAAHHDDGHAHAEEHAKPATAPAGAGAGD